MYRFLLNPYFQADGGNNGGGDDQNQGTDNQNNNGNPGADSSNTGNTIPYDRFKKVNDERNDFKNKYESLIQQQQEEENNRKEQQGEFESLYTELKGKYDPIEQELTAYREAFKDILALKLEQVPADMRDLIPEGNQLFQLQWIEKSLAKGLFGNTQQQKSFGNNGSNPGNGALEMTPEQFNKLSYAERNNLYKTNPDLYNKLKN
ncbi:hypothetical protein NL868_001313 [Shigella flexneri]|nr:hypothetical protein [Shigella flexneri]